MPSLLDIPPQVAPERRDAPTDPLGLPPGRYLLMDRDRGLVAVRLDREVTHLGRGLSCHVRLDEATVSRRHAIVLRRGDETLLLDDRSIDGTALNGERVDRAVLRHGDAIGLGRARLEYVDIRPGARPATAEAVPLLCCR